jgi:UDP-3-O-[3-hydroxymyristoyl] glucosamine N-acyltransferase
MSATLGELAVRFGCELKGDPDTAVDSVGSLAEAGPRQIAFLANPRYRRQLADTRAAAVILEPSLADACPVASLLSGNPHVTYARIAVLLHPLPPPEPGVHPSAVVDPTAQLASDASIGPLAVIGARVAVGARAAIGPGCVIEAGASIGADTRLVANVTVCRGVTLGARCILHPGVVIGADGFGLARDGEGWIKVPQVGSVVIGDDVEIGANTTVDRGALEDTVLEDGVKLDNQIQIGHNVRVGAHTAIAACSGVSGSVTIGRRCMLGGMVGVVGHLSICDDVVITGLTMVSATIRKPGMYSSGFPAQETAVFRRNVARFRNLDRLLRELGARTRHADDTGQDDD